MHAEDGGPQVEACRSAHLCRDEIPGTEKLNLTAAIILSGSPYSVYAEDAPHVDPAVFEAGVPVLGICYGLQQIAKAHGGNVDAHTHREYGYAKITVKKTGNKQADMLFEGIEMDEDGGMQVRSKASILAVDTRR